MATIRVINNIIRQKTCHYNRIPSLLSPPSLLLLCNGNKVIIKKYSNEKKKSEITHFENNATDNQVSTSFAEVVKENTKSAWYVSVIVAGVGITALMFYAIFRELFSDKSPSSVYSKAVDKCVKDPKVIDALGEPIKAYGEESRRGRRRHTNHVVYQHNGRTYMRMKFYIQGVRKRGTVNLEMREDDNGNFVYRYLFIQLEDMFRSVIVLEDNRAAEGDSNKSDKFAPQNFPILSNQ
ncbi:mitochondrial import inner membrane translocase subunit Tim21-like [Microplitis mediator]|uniref:mitochondrial import inner membrane translocase subunit Tim21-like n=1 Tax=Microplitis mediator TaxID=375433 RepID=UPI002556F500|nr:mitochondrial import inner membrane translocase subunit Tim21-like [Microplitis mediator]